MNGLWGVMQERCGQAKGERFRLDRVSLQGYALVFAKFWWKQWEKHALRRWEESAAEDRAASRSAAIAASAIRCASTCARSCATSVPSALTCAPCAASATIFTIPMQSEILLPFLPFLLARYLLSTIANIPESVVLTLAPVAHKLGPWKNTQLLVQRMHLP